MKPLGFRIDDRSKRAGLDYWKKLDFVVWESMDDYMDSLKAEIVVLTSSKRGELYHRIRYTTEDHILFGSETSGLPAGLFSRFPGRIARIPVRLDQVRSLNLSSSAGIIVYEALKQTGTLPF